MVFSPSSHPSVQQTPEHSSAPRRLNAHTGAMGCMDLHLSCRCRRVIHANANYAMDMFTSHVQLQATGSILLHSPHTWLLYKLFWVKRRVKRSNQASQKKISLGSTTQDLWDLDSWKNKPGRQKSPGLPSPWRWHSPWLCMGVSSIPVNCSTSAGSARPGCPHHE